ncbi:unnamed protein product [Somion occarium]|uniref:Large ribosomal subunit protein mL46 n=1 Tax=Somion occarium TaxID=3059160 RepID=A0ABP1DSS0_9APHY
MGQQLFDLYSVVLMFSRSALSSCRVSRKVQCLSSPTRSLASVASTSSAIPSPPPPRQKSASGTLKPVLNTAVILTRSPIITRTPTPFERTYFGYHARIQRALHNPFPYDFYFKPGSLLEGRFREKEREREREAFGGPRKTSTTAEEGAEDAPAAAKDVEVLGGEEEVTTVPREHESDRNGDVKDLNRQGERNLHLLILGKNASGKHVWRFPQGGLEQDELLHEAAQRDLHAECGAKMDTWIVSRNPIGVHQPSPEEQLYVFFYKARILSGQVHPDGNNVTDFAWLTKQEIEPRVERPYWLGIKDMLADF